MSKSNDPNEWAVKRRVAMERAKQIREDRKAASGTLISHYFFVYFNNMTAFQPNSPPIHTIHTLFCTLIPSGDATFNPQINKRPSYLNNVNSSDALDALTTNAVSRYDRDDVFEQPLPGKFLLISDSSLFLHLILLLLLSLSL